MSILGLKRRSRVVGGAAVLAAGLVPAGVCDARYAAPRVMISLSPAVAPSLAAPGLEPSAVRPAASRGAAAFLILAAPGLAPAAALRVGAAAPAATGASPSSLTGMHPLGPRSLKSRAAKLAASARRSAAALGLPDLSPVPSPEEGARRRVELLWSFHGDDGAFHEARTGMYVFAGPGRITWVPDGPAGVAVAFNLNYRVRGLQEGEDQGLGRPGVRDSRAVQARKSEDLLPL